jgi:hypothetical protein
MALDIPINIKVTTVDVNATFQVFCQHSLANNRFHYLLAELYTPHLVRAES